jgi:class 3 adenylate cyclase
MAGEAPKTKYTNRSGTWLAYQVVGDAATDVLLLSDWSLPLDFRWDEPVAAAALRRLASFSRLISFDKRGVGCSERVPIVESTPAEAWVEDAITVMDEVRSERACVFANGDAGGVGILLAAMHPERVSSLVLHNTAACWLRKPDWPSGLPLDVFERMTYDDDRLRDDLEEGYSLFAYRAPSFRGDDAIRERFARWRRIQGGPTVIGPLSRATVELDLRAVLPTIQAPTLVAHAVDNQMVRVENGRATADLIEGSRFVELATADHLFWGRDQALVLDEVEAFVTGVRPVPHADRVLLTIVFADIVSSTRHAAAVGDDAWRRTLATFDSLSRERLSAFRGTYVKSTGDGLLATFDGPARAARFAGEVVSQAAALGISVRAGIHTGEVERVEQDIVGIAVHAASRICDLAGPDEVLTSRTVRDLAAGSGLRFESRGEHELRGLTEAFELFVATAP